MTFLSIFRVSLFLLSLLLLESCSSKSDNNSVAQIETDSVYLPIVGTGPNNEIPATIKELQNLLKNVDPQKITKKPVIAICMHDLQNDWSKAIVKGITETVGKYGLKITVVTDGEFNLAKQRADLANVIALKPDIMLVLPLDADSLSSVLKEAVHQNIKLAFIDAVPNGFKAKEDYTAWAVGDAFVMGKGGAELLCDCLDNRGKVAMLNWKNRMFTVDRRSQAAREVFKNRTGITLVQELFFDDFSEIAGLIDQLLIEHPDLAGLWVVWDTPAFEAIKIIKKRNAKTLVTASDMSLEVARAIANSDVLVGTAVDHPFDEGVIEGLIAVAIAANIEIPSYFVVPAEKVTAATLSAAWSRMYHTQLPSK